MLDYLAILETTYAEQDTTKTGDAGAFTFTIKNPEWEGGDITVTSHSGSLLLSFATMQQEYRGDFGTMVALIDELLADESMVFELYSHGEDVLGGCRGTDEIEIDRSLSAFARSLCEGDPCLWKELKAIIAQGQCYCKLRGWHKARCRSLLLS